VEAIMNAATETSLDMKVYLRLVRKFPLVPIKNMKQLDRATKVIHELMDINWKRERTSTEEAYFSVLCELIGKYEDRVYPHKQLDDGETLFALIEAQDLTQAAAARGVGIAESTLSEVLSGKRKLTRKQIGKIAKWFNVSPDLFRAGV
jgi:HTH-type transcriptional regulator/antitoxin HigA